MFRNNSLIVKFLLLFALVIALMASAYLLMLRNVYQEQLHSQARTIADQVEAFGSWVSQYGRVWVKDNNTSYLGELVLIPSDADPKVTTPSHFYSKNPALAQREFSEAVARSKTPAQFRMTSDNVMNPANKADAFEAEAIRIIRAKNLKEYAEVRDGVYRYARTLIHQESCINCHGAAESAPADVTIRYGTVNGFGFKVGDVAGVISVKVPTASLWDTSLKVLGPLEIFLIVASFILAFLFMRYGVVVPIKKLTQAADTLSTGTDVNMNVHKIKENSSNELHQLALSLGRLRTSLQIAIQRMKGRT